jgi:hypothetical protein
MSGSRHGREVAIICHGIPGKDRGTGLHLESASKAVKCLESRGLLVCERSSGGRTIYHVRLIPEVYGKSEHEERKSSSEKNVQKERNTERSAQRKSPATPKAPRNPEALLNSTPEDELRDIYRTKTATEISPTW